MKKLLITLLFVLPATVFAECSINNGQVEYGNCLVRENHQSKLRLDEIYNRTYKVTDAKSDLAIAQDLWSRYKLAQCEAVKSQAGTGSGAGNQYVQCLTDHNKARIKELNEF